MTISNTGRIMTKRRTVIVGASGFVGGHLSRAISNAQEFDLIPFVDPLGGNRVDLRHPQSVKRAIAHTKPDVVFLLAGIAAPRQANDQPLMAWQTNVMGTAHVAYAVLDHVPDAHLIWAGSSEAYGDAFNRTAQPVEETASLLPLSSYGATKAAADIMLRQLAHIGLRSTIVRPFNHTGPGQSDTYVVPAFAKQIALIEKGLQEPILKIGNLSASRDFLDIQDVISAYMLIAKNDAIRPGTAYNISTGSPVRIHDILNILISLSSSRFDVQVDENKFASSSVPITSGNPDFSFKELNWKATTPFIDTLSGVLDYWRLKVDIYS
jgi:GDP-4-dehydro-6-deoxy-D-mannose reductase